MQFVFFRVKFQEYELLHFPPFVQICSSIKFFIKNRSITGQIVAVDSGQNLNWQTPDIIGLKE